MTEAFGLKKVGFFPRPIDIEIPDSKYFRVGKQS